MAYGHVTLSRLVTQSECETKEALDVVIMLIGLVQASTNVYLHGRLVLHIDVEVTENKKTVLTGQEGFISSAGEK